ncbi:hypothetical protein [Actinomadura formosensis]|uniref:hypothetical protein n=1 Tax=Actinomadura formosensis TaxID=60706 RepID=UPI000B213208|nr:hypothetical protein [Actinomadura formosensis]
MHRDGLPIAHGPGTSAYVTVNIRRTEWRGVLARLRCSPAGLERIVLAGGGRA